MAVEAGRVAYVCPARLGGARKAALQRQLVAKCGFERCAEKCDDSVTHIFIEDDLPIEHISQSFAGGSECNKSKTLVRISWIPKHAKDSSVGLDSFVIKLSAQGIVETNTDTVLPESSVSTDQSIATSDIDGTKPPAKRRRFVCETSALDDASPQAPFNANIISTLQLLADGYKSTNDKWRALSYEKAIKMIERLDHQIESKEEVLKLKGIGERIANKIVEIIESGSLRKAENFANNERVQAMQLLTNIWGVGPAIAEQWYAKGVRTLDDIQNKGVKLNHQQEIGFKYYHELLERMPRSEATSIVEKVRVALVEIDPSFIMEACGSYRRGKQTCGDVDILITHKDGTSHEHILGKLVQKLTDDGFLTDHLVECATDQNHKKYMGVCMLDANNAKHRRIDIISVPYSEHGPSLIYFTGSAHFTRSIYARAKSMGMRLNQHGLRAGVMRQAGERLNEGYLIETPTERSVFEALGLEYRTPAERDHS